MINLEGNTLLINYYKESRTKSATRMRIMTVIVELLEENLIYIMNVTMVCEKLNMTRRQFYRYYASLESALFDAVAVVNSVIADVIARAINKVSDQTEDVQLRTLFNGLRSEHSIIGAKLIEKFNILSINGSEEDLNRFRELLNVTTNHLDDAVMIVENGINNGIFKNINQDVVMNVKLAFISYYSLVNYLYNRELTQLNLENEVLLDLFLDDIIKKFKGE